MEINTADMLAWQYAHYLKRRSAGHEKKRKDFLALLRPKDRLAEYGSDTVEGLRTFTDNLKAAIDETRAEEFPPMANRDEIMAYAKARIRMKMREKG